MRIKEFQKKLQEKKIDYVLLSNLKNKDPNILYFTQADIDYVSLLIPKKGLARVYAPGIEYERAKKSSKIKVCKQKGKLIKEIKKKIRGKVGINKAELTVKEFEALKKELKSKKIKGFVDVSNVLQDLRKIKTKKEISLIKKACKITDKVFMKTKKNFKKFKKELEVAEFIEKEIKKCGGEVAFPVIVASGKNASMPHYRPAGKLQKGFCIIDFGARYKGYCSDMTRTLYIGKPSAKEKELYTKMLEIQENIIAKIKPGMSLKAIDKESRKHHKYPHAAGHGIGIEVHESPGFGPKSKEIAKKGMVMAIEPAIYKQGKFGIRIEDTCIITESCCRTLTKASKRLISIG